MLCILWFVFYQYETKHRPQHQISSVVVEVLHGEVLLEKLLVAHLFKIFPVF
jgi:hypothetical protein